MKAIKYKHEIRIGFSFLIIVFVAILLFQGGVKLFSKNSNASTKSSSKTTLVKSTTNNTKDNSLTAFPTVPISCSTSISLVQLSGDYIVTGMGCQPDSPPSNMIVLNCDGTIFSGSVSLNCYPPDQQSGYKQLVCSGSISYQSNQANVPISYSCSLPNLSGSNLYNCSGDINSYNSSSINLPMSVNCVP